MSVQVHMSPRYVRGIPHELRRQQRCQESLRDGSAWHWWSLEQASLLRSRTGCRAPGCGLVSWQRERDGPGRQQSQVAQRKMRWRPGMVSEPERFRSRFVFCCISFSSGTAKLGCYERLRSGVGRSSRQQIVSSRSSVVSSQSVVSIQELVASSQYLVAST